MYVDQGKSAVLQWIHIDSFRRQVHCQPQSRSLPLIFADRRLYTVNCNNILINVTAYFLL